MVDINDDFLAELRLNVEFNRILAQETKQPMTELAQANDAAYRAYLKQVGKRGRKAIAEMQKQTRSPSSSRRRLFG